MKLFISLITVLLQLMVCWPTTITEVQIIQPPIEQKMYKTYREDNDPRQDYINYAYQIWGMEHVILLECEREGWDPQIEWDWWDAAWLCQMNSRFHTIPAEYYSDPFFQIQYCFDKRQWWTKFYWPERDMSWEPCYLAVQKHFILK